jgi:uncharacterized protein (DUF362 family)
MSTELSLVKCANYDPAAIAEALSYSLALLGGITNFINPNSRVLVKPNLLMSKGPEYAITTHPEVVRAVIRMLKEINCKVFVGDGPGSRDQSAEDISGVYQATGIEKVCHEENVPLVYFDKRRMRNKFPLTTWLDECDHLISLPKFKTHQLTLITGAVKNMYGLIPGTYKVELHKNYFLPPEFAKIVVDIYQEAKPDLTIIDGILALEGDGPGTSGTVRQLGLILTGADGVALDAVMAKIMGIDPGKVLTTKEAAARNLGEDNLDRIEIRGQDPGHLNIRPFILPKNAAVLMNMSPVVRKILLPLATKIFKTMIKYYPYSLVSKCTRCGFCVKVCPKQCIRLNKKSIQEPKIKNIAKTPHETTVPRRRLFLFCFHG